MRVTTSYGCQQCDEIIPSCPKGVCPRCGSQAVYPLATRGADAEQQWQSRIRKSLKPPARRVQRLTHNMALHLTDWRKED